MKQTKTFRLSLKSAVLRIFAIVLLCLFSSNALAGGITAMRFGNNIGNLRIVFDADKEFDYKVFLLTEPRRLVVDAENISIAAKIEKQFDANGVVSQTRISTTDGNTARIVFDLVEPVIIKKAFMLPPQSSFGWRFVIDLSAASPSEFNKNVGAGNAHTNSGKTNSSNKTTAKKATSAENPSLSVKKIIVLDPGHGGRDPGAIGYSGVYEKNITLAMAKELKILLEDNGYKVHLTRTTDIFIPLRDRVRTARKHKADLFISIHADSTYNRRAKGLSVFTLSETASDKEAEALAERENKADVIDGLDLGEHSKEVSDILLNLAQRETMNRSSEFATFMVKEMKNAVNLVNNTHQFAGFAVLKAPDVPSVLLEMGYLSNATEERLLKQADYRRRLGVSTKNAIDKYFENMRRASLF